MRQLADFALSSSARGRDLTQEVVTLWYRAPELLLGGAYDQGVDVWSVGCVFAEMALGRPLFRGDSEVGQLFSIFQALGTPHEGSWPGVEQLPFYRDRFPKWETRLLELLSPRQGTRMKEWRLRRAWERPYLQAILQSTFTYSPQQRSSASTILRMIESWRGAVKRTASLTFSIIFHRFSIKFYPFSILFMLLRLAAGQEPCCEVLAICRGIQGRPLRLKGELPRRPRVFAETFYKEIMSYIQEFSS